MAEKKKKKLYYVYFMLLVLILINLYMSVYFIFLNDIREIWWMGLVSLFAAVILSGLLYRFIEYEKRGEVKRFNEHIKSDEDRMIK